VVSHLGRFRARPTQLTVRATHPMPDGVLHRIVVEALATAEPRLAVEVLDSGHTVDVIAQGVSKLTVVGAVRSAFRKFPGNLHSRHARIGDVGESLTLQVMTVGDQGQAGGNDGAFLRHPLGLSVENVSSVLDGCWNIAPAGTRRTAALLRYLDALRPKTSGVLHLSVVRAGGLKPFKSVDRHGRKEESREAL
jgi:hypothetical protein